MTEIVRPTKYTEAEIRQFMQGSDLEKQGVHADTLVAFLKVLPAGSINVENDKIVSFGRDASKKTKPISEFTNSVKRVLKSVGGKDASAEQDPLVLDKALKNFTNVDLSKYVSDGEHLITGNDFSSQLIAYMNDNRSSLAAHRDFNPTLFGAVMATFVAEVPDNIQTQADKASLIGKMVPFAAGAIAKLSTKFAGEVGTNKLVLAADPEQKTLVLDTIRDSVTEANKANSSDPKVLELVGKEYMRGDGVLLKIRRSLSGVQKQPSLRSALLKEYQRTKADKGGRGL